MGWRSRHYDPAPTAALEYVATDLTPLDAAAVAALAGAAGGNAVRHNDLATSWTPVLSTDLAGTGPLTHTGTYRVWARVYSTSPTPPKLRFLYDVGDFTLPEENDRSAIPAAGNFYIRDLGQLRIDKAPYGTHRWKGVIQAKGAAGGENVYVDRVWFQPLDEGAGRLVALQSADVGLATYVARDGFNQSAGALDGKSLDVGGTWATSGSATDLAVETVGKTVQRSTTGDAGNGRFAIASPAGFADQAVAIDIACSVDSALGGTPALVLQPRYADANNRLNVALTIPTGQPALQITKLVGGSPTILVGSKPVPFAPNVTHTLQALVDAAGRWWVWFFRAGGAAGVPVAAGHDADLAAGGALASGQVGFRDLNASSTACTRTYDNFRAWVPTLDAVIFAGQSAYLSHDGMTRLDATGTSPGPVSEVIGDLPRIPASGAEGRPVELFLLPSRGDFDQLPDTSRDDDFDVEVTYRPAYLFRP